MARPHLTLAALATAAVPGIDLVNASGFTAHGDAEFRSALLTDRDGSHWIIRIPRSPRAEAQQSADLVALRALSPGVRERLPFAVSTYAGQVAHGSTRAIVYRFVYGAKVDLGALDAGHDGLAASVGRALAAVHSLQTGFVADAGLPQVTPIESLRSAVSVIDRAAATGLVPQTLLERWQKAVDDSTLWQYQPAVINGAMSAESLLVQDRAVTGILGWHELRVGDPARDLAWILGSRGEGVADSAFDAYIGARPGDRQVRQRATLYAELEVAKWLLHGTDTRSTDIVDDAVEMLGGLVDSTENDVMNPIHTQQVPTGPTAVASADAGDDDVELTEFLARAERAV